MNQTIATKLKQLPKESGVYFHKDAKGEIIYVGKAAVLNNRVRQYFQKSRSRDPKTDALVKEIADIDWQVVDSEMEALFLEAELIRRYKPRYNILLRDDKAMAYIRINYNSDHPTVSTTRRPLDDGARYFGPYFSVTSVRRALKVLRRVFPYATRKIGGQKRATLHYHLGLDPGLEEGRTSLTDYRANLRKLIKVIEGKKTQVEKELEKDMKKMAQAKDFEAAAKVRNQIYALRNLSRQTIFSDKEFLDISKDHALNELAELLGLYEREPQRSHAGRVQGSDKKWTEPYKGTAKGVSQSVMQQSTANSASVAGSASRQDRVLRSLRRIEGYDISHMSGTNVVASMVVFTNGVSDKAEYRKFKVAQKNDDFHNMSQVISRRLSEKNIRTWGKPDLFLIDGGKGQLDAAIKARDTHSIVRASTYHKDKSTGVDVQGRSSHKDLVFIGLAMREEQIVIQKGKSNVEVDEDVLKKLGGFKTESENFILINLPKNTNLIKLLQRIRDESHRFAVSYHSSLKRRQQTASVLEEIPGIGPATRKKLIRNFGSAAAVKDASEADIAKIIGKQKARQIKANIT